ncbi:MAG: AlpA family transcriptional regulator [Pusillimonas sp.]|nr:AlpA family transcriptional regulator [Pusillimonas sp.]MBC43969.1 AlpA family transcriptional regulator [Pusillimonas sp.]HCP78651.1 AlpA family transcriptional regulator [Pusillimonas sp.]
MTIIHSQPPENLPENSNADDRSIQLHSGFLRLSHIIGDRKKGVKPLVPVSRSTWYAGVAAGRFPKPIRLSEGVSVWRASDIDALCRQIEQQTEA